MNLKNKVALITGSAKRIGKALAIALASEGCDIIVHYGQSEKEARQTVVEIQEIGRKAWLNQVNLEIEAEVKAIVHFALIQAGRIDILINNASLFSKGTFLGTDSETWDQNMAVNLKAPFILSQEFARALPKGQHGHIINMLDAIAMRPKDHHVAYTISKLALDGLTKTTAYALASQGIQVNGIALGTILQADTPDKKEHGNFKLISKRAPLPRKGSTQDVINAMLYLLQSADYTTGEVIRVDGGIHLV